MLNWFIVTVTGICYIWLISKYIRGLKTIFSKTGKCSSMEPVMQAAVVVALRNEENTVGDFLERFLHSDNILYTKEIILVNDHSEDATPDIIQQYASRHSKIKALNQKKGFIGKKQSLLLGINRATCDIILTTDADCRVGNLWVKNHLLGYTNRQVQVQAGLVMMHGHSLFERLQEIEFASLMASATGASGIGKPIMINGANLSFRKDTYLQIHNHLFLHHPSGDDMFLLQSIKESQPDAFRFIVTQGSEVKTLPQKSFKAFLHQRLRWAAKSHLYTDKDILLSGAIVFVTNLFLLGFLLLGILYAAAWKYYLVLVLLKTIPDFALLQRYFNQTGHPKNRGLFVLPIQILYPFYAVGVAVLSQLVKINWKNRSYLARNRVQN